MKIALSNRNLQKTVYFELESKKCTSFILYITIKFYQLQTILLWSSASIFTAYDFITPSQHLRTSKVVHFKATLINLFSTCVVITSIARNRRIVNLPRNEI